VPTVSVPHTGDPVRSVGYVKGGVPRRSHAEALFTRSIDTHFGDEGGSSSFEVAVAAGGVEIGGTGTNYRR
jgi:hypothetical protein